MPRPLGRHSRWPRPDGARTSSACFPTTPSCSIPTLSLRRGKSLVGVFMGATRPRVDIPRYIGLWERGLLDLESMVSDVIPLDGANDGFAALKRGEVARAVVSFA